MCTFVEFKQREPICSVDFSHLIKPTKLSFHRCVQVTSVYLMHDIYHTIVKQGLVRLPHTYKMGTNCSYNFYDTRHWDSLEQKSTVDTSRLGKRMRYFRKRAQSDPTSDTSQGSPELCSCHQQLRGNTNSEHSGTMFIFPTNASNLPANLRAPLSQSEIFETAATKVSNNRLFSNPNVVGHVKLSRIFGSGKDSPKTNNDSSPQRLLTRRCHSPSYRTGAYGYNSRPPCGSPGFERQRSMSWSNGRIGTKEYMRVSSPTLKTSMLCSARSQRGSPTHHPGSPAYKPYQNASMLPHSPVKSLKGDAHHPQCPLHVKSSHSKQSTRTSQLINDELQAGWTPVARRRANSESYTPKLHRLMPRSLDSGDIHEHAHVHWADEESGSSLSTSVFVSSLRPRSYSHGAVDSTPSRPILKKILG